MNLEKDIRPISYLKTNAADLLDQINETRRPVVITQSGKVRAVLQNADSYEKMTKALGLLKRLSMSEVEIEKGNRIEQNDLFQTISEKLEAYQ